PRPSSSASSSRTRSSTAGSGCGSSWRVETEMPCSRSTTTAGSTTTSAAAPAFRSSAPSCATSYKGRSSSATRRARVPRSFSLPNHPVKVHARQLGAPVPARQPSGYAGKRAVSEPGPCHFVSIRARANVVVLRADEIRTSSTDMTEPPQLEPHTVVLLRWPERLPDLTDDELDALQAEHVAFQRSLRERGIIGLAGPFDGQPDEGGRGLR